MQHLWKHHDWSIFHEPVDPVEYDIPDYLDVIKNPMDFGTINQKIVNG